MAEIFKVENLDKAIILANHFKSTGKYDLFRGQSQNWPVIPTAARLTEQEFEENYEKLERIKFFFKLDPLLEKYASNVDWFYAVAQHYSMGTNYIDFTSSVEVAAFFATNSKSNESNQDCVIICLNESDFKELAQHANSFYPGTIIPPQIVKINVDNLWRLQAQKGCFLFTPYREIEQFYDFDRIIFPFTSAYKGLLESEIYPKRKSELEILLDQYFNHERRIKGRKKFEELTREMGTTLLEMPAQDTIIKHDMPHSSWLTPSNKRWHFTIKEEWTNKAERLIEIDFPFHLSLQPQIDMITHDLIVNFSKYKIDRMANLNFTFKSGSEDYYEVFSKISSTCVRIWDGTRMLPYSNEEICSMIGKYICFEFHEHKFDEIPTISNEEIIVLELTNAYGSITRCCATPSKVAACFREDLQNVLIDELTGLESCELLLHINNPRVIFDFDKLTKLFADELVVYQALHNSEEKNPVTFYTPAQITVLGYA